MQNTRRLRDSQNALTPFSGGLNNFWDDFWGFPSLFQNKAWGENSSFLPSLDVSETDKEFQIQADLPGFDSKDISVEIEDSGIVISGKKDSTSEDKGKNYLRCERSSGSFYRKVNFPPNADLENVKCKSKNGVLSITIPKLQETKKKEVKIEIED